MLGLYFYAWNGLSPFGALFVGWLCDRGGTQLAFTRRGRLRARCNRGRLRTCCADGTRRSSAAYTRGLSSTFKLVARTGHPSFLDLPWHTPLEEWDVGPARRR